MENEPGENSFFDKISNEFELVKILAPYYVNFQKKLGGRIAEFIKANRSGKVSCLEIGCGIGITTEIILSSFETIFLTAIDNEPGMVNLISEQMQPWIEKKRLKIINVDALAYLTNATSHSFDIVVSAMTIHNFHRDYRHSCLAEIHKVLNNGGLFINGDRYALSPEIHHKMLMTQIRRFFDVLVPRSQIESLKDWVLHLIDDENPNRIMWLDDAICELSAIGYIEIDVTSRIETEAILTALKA